MPDLTTCVICGLPADVVDLDADVAYCDLHADERLVCAGNHTHIHPSEPS